MKPLLFVLTIVSFIAQSLHAQMTTKPNILFIAVDDLKPIMGCYGNKGIKTPNIDRLAKMGTTFMNNHCQQAVCGPTRASLLTGKRPDATKIYDLKTQMRDMNPNILTLPQYFTQNNYQTVGIGKLFHPSSAIDKVDPISWSIPYLNPSPEDYANNLGEPTNGQYQDPFIKKIFVKERKPRTGPVDADIPTSIKGPSFECIDVPDHAYDDGVYALKAKAQMIKMSREKAPFLMAVGFQKPHLPFVAPKKYWDLYDRESMPLASFQEHAKNSPLVAYHKSGELLNYPDIPASVTLSGDSLRIGLKVAKQKELIHGYYAAVSYMDAQVGILLNTLDSLGITNNTIVVLWGDHGWHLGDHDLWVKHSTYEQATRSPLIISAPGIKAGKSSSPTEHVDIFPTLCQLAGLPIPKDLDGISLTPVMRNNKLSVKEFAMSQYPRRLNNVEAKKLGYTNPQLMGYSLRTDKYRYTLWMNHFTSKSPFDAKKVYAAELYDYSKDPLEKINVANEPEYAKISSSLNEKMIQFFKSQLN
jgi:arylsulfatase A-like enzyme